MVSLVITTAAADSAYSVYNGVVERVYGAIYYTSSCNNASYAAAHWHRATHATTAAYDYNRTLRLLVTGRFEHNLFSPTRKKNEKENNVAFVSPRRLYNTLLLLFMQLSVV